MPWRREWQPTPVFLPGEFHGQKSLAGYSPWDHKESDMTEQLHTHKKGLKFCLAHNKCSWIVNVTIIKWRDFWWHCYLPTVRYSHRKPQAMPPVLCAQCCLWWKLHGPQGIWAAIKSWPGILMLRFLKGARWTCLMGNSMSKNLEGGKKPNIQERMILRGLRTEGNYVSARIGTFSDFSSFFQVFPWKTKRNAACPSPPFILLLSWCPV